MSIQVTCGCGKKLKVNEEFAGKQGKCPGCGKALIIPGVRQPAEKRPQAGTRCPSCNTDLAPNAVLCVNCGMNLKTGKKMKTASIEEVDRPKKTEAIPEMKKPGSLPSWCRLALKIDIVWSWMVVGIVIGLFIYYNRGTSTAEIKEWGIVGFFVALFATLANLRLLKGKRSGIWLGYVTLVITLVEQWMRIDENLSNKAVVATVAVFSLLYDIAYFLTIFTVGKAMGRNQAQASGEKAE